MNIETHPFEPFIPPSARILMAGSFPPQPQRWCMDWYYPNFQNDMWRIWGYIASGDKNLFVDTEHRTFRQQAIEEYCTKIGLALSDSALQAIRLKDNASDKFLEVVTPRDFNQLLLQMPLCHTIALTGEKAVDTVDSYTGCGPIAVGSYATVNMADREVKIWRMPSSSRAYPRSVEWKAEFYRRLLDS